MVIAADLRRRRKQFDAAAAALHAGQDPTPIIHDVRTSMAACGRHLLRLLLHGAIERPRGCNAWLLWSLPKQRPRPRFVGVSGLPHSLAWNLPITVTGLVGVLNNAQLINAEHRAVRTNDLTRMRYRLVFGEAISGWLGRRCTPRVLVPLTTIEVRIDGGSTQPVDVDWAGEARQPHRDRFLELATAAAVCCSKLADDIDPAAWMQPSPESLHGRDRTEDDDHPTDETTELAGNASQTDVDWTRVEADIKDATLRAQVHQLIIQHERTGRPPANVLLDAIRDRENHDAAMAELRSILDNDEADPSSACWRWRNLTEWGCRHFARRTPVGREVVHFQGAPVVESLRSSNTPCKSVELLWARATKDSTTAIFPLARAAGFDTAGTKAVHVLARALGSVLQGKEVDLDQPIRDVELLVAEVDAQARLRSLPAAEQTPRRPTQCIVTRTSPASATVQEGGTSVTVKGPRRVQLLLQVVEAARTLTWRELVEGDIKNAGAVLDRRIKSKAASGSRLPKNWVDPSSCQAPKMATQAKSLQNLGSRIRRDLGKLGYHWNQDGTGVTWSSDCQ